MEISVKGEMTQKSLSVALDQLKKHLGPDASGFWNFTITFDAYSADGRALDLTDGQAMELDLSGLGRPIPIDRSPKKPKPGFWRHTTGVDGRTTIGWYEDEGDFATRQASELQRVCSVQKSLDGKLRAELFQVLEEAFLVEFARDPEELVATLNALIAEAWHSNKPVRERKSGAEPIDLPVFELAVGRLQVRRRATSPFTPIKSPFAKIPMWTHAAWSKDVLPKLTGYLKSRCMERGEAWDSDAELAVYPDPILPADFGLLAFPHGRKSPSLLDHLRQELKVDLQTVSRVAPGFPVPNVNPDSNVVNLLGSANAT